MNEPNPLLDPRLGSAIFYPRQDMGWGTKHPFAEDWMVDVADGVRLRLRHYPAPDSAPTILFFHGNGETARDYDELAQSFNALPATLVIAEYRGYGPSSGSPHLLTFLEDAHGCLDEVRRRFAGAARGEKIVVMGRSLGSAPAIELVATRGSELSGLIVESGFAQVVPLLQLIGVPAAQLGITEDHGPRSEAKMAQVSLPTLVMHAENDEILPFEEGERLFDACGDPDKTFFPVAHAGHNDIQYVAGDAYFEAIAQLMKRI